MTLLIDMGNSRIKWRRTTDSTMEIAENVPAALRGMRSGAAPRRIAIAATASQQQVEALLAPLREQWPEATVLVPVSEARFGPLRNSYAEPARMGVDRWLAMIAARQAWDGETLVIDAGTALTCDRVAAGGAHLGGWIIPGLAMMRGALGTATARVGAHAGEAPGRWGCDTQGAVLAGTRAALAAVVASACAELATSAAYRIFVTGGDMAVLDEALAPWRDHIQCEPGLVMHGLALWAAEHEATAC